MIARVGRKLPHVVRAFVYVVEAFLDAFAFVLNLWKLEYDFCSYACDVEADDVYLSITHIIC